MGGLLCGIHEFLQIQAWMRLQEKGVHHSLHRLAGIVDEESRNACVGKERRHACEGRSHRTAWTENHCRLLRRKRLHARGA